MAALARLYPEPDRSGDVSTVRVGVAVPGLADKTSAKPPASGTADFSVMRRCEPQ